MVMQTPSPIGAVVSESTVRSVASRDPPLPVHSIMEAAIQELRYAARRLARTPAFTLIALATLALAIGASTAAFSLVNGVLLKPLGFERPDRLVYLHGTDARATAKCISPQDLIDFRNQTHSFTAIAAVESRQNLNLLRPKAPPLRVNAARVGAEFFSVLGTRAQLGRTFAPGEDARTATKVLVLSDGAWRRYFGADPGSWEHRSRSTATPTSWLVWRRLGSTSPTTPSSGTPRYGKTGRSATSAAAIIMQRRSRGSATASRSRAHSAI